MTAQARIDVTVTIDVRRSSVIATMMVEQPESEP
jgi:hypothetical protein